MADHPTLTELDGVLPFVERHIGLRDADIATMLGRLGFASLDALMDAAVPGGIRAPESLDLPTPLSEEATARELRHVASQNRPGEAMIGLGYPADGALDHPVKLTRRPFDEVVHRGRW